MFKGKRDDFLSNKENKHSFITLLQDHLERQGCHTEQSTADADLLILQTAIAASGVILRLVFTGLERKQH